MFGGLHWYDLLVLLALALLIFGPKRLPEMGSSIGKTIKEFQRSMREVKEPEPTGAVPPATSQAAPELPSASAVSTSPAETPKD
ncbi:MAG TPA: twin-arginine translocase TatA/TatE family subunit [Ktedonobacterales bacterium]